MEAERKESVRMGNVYKREERMGWGGDGAKRGLEGFQTMARLEKKCCYQATYCLLSLLSTHLERIYHFKEKPNKEKGEMRLFTRVSSSGDDV